ncbi:hypothetical protein QBC43DRAFT_62189 [Cladorrhinum sp. PSN259]|nr:hypothetical protein QBC43DRAFT_62189 [Cladorrhinum sp. PSN259]
MDASSRSSSLLALPTTPASGLQIFALFVNFFFPALALVVVSIRVAGRVATAHFAIDDWLVCIAMLMSIAQTILSFFFIKTNFVGIPFSQVPARNDPTQALIWAYAVQILYNPILALVKSSVLVFLGRLFGQKDGIRKFVLWLNVANVSQMVAVFFAITLQCTPIAFNWDFSIRGGKCVDRRVLYTSTAVFNIVMDLLILGTPVGVFWKLKIPRRTKIGLLMVFMLGFLVTITSTVRLILLLQGLFNLQVINDPTRNIGFITSGIETNLALITASAPALRPIFRSRDRGGWFGTRTSPATVVDNDLEAKPAGWDSPAEPPPSAARGGKGSRRGGRGGRLSTRRTAQQTKSGRGGGRLKPIIRIKTDVGAELRSQSPRTSEEETMTSNGIRKMSDVRREVDGIVKEIGVAGNGTYVGRPSMETITIGTTISPISRPSTRDGLARPTTRDGTRDGRPTTRDGPTRDGLQQRPSTRDGQSGTATGTGIATGRRFYGPPERYYSESIYPTEPTFEPPPDPKPVTESKLRLDLRIRDEERKYYYNDDIRVSRRYGVVTPREGRTPTTATSIRGWDEGGGRPF